MLSFILTALVAALITPVVIHIYTQKKWLDNPATHTHAKKTHTTPVPRGGGLVIFLSILLLSFFFLHYDSYLFAIMAGAAILAFVGFLDDVYDIHPLIRLGVNVLVALIVVGSGIGISYISSPFSTSVIHLNMPQLTFELFGQERTIWVLADFFAVLFIVWNMNIVNWSKGVDGQMPGFVSIALIFIGILSTRFVDDPTSFNTTQLSFIAAGAFAGFLFWNWYPQKIMPGYGGGSLAGYFLSVLAILSGAKVATALMVLAIPTSDALFTITRRLLRGKSPFWGDRGHLHHKLIDVFHWGKRRIAVFYWLTSFILGFLSLYLNTVQKLITITLVLLSVAWLLVWAKIKTLQQQHETN
ncbi:undecaprenyl/decaprenyl-phosphate alpha-N-acetylglucosaminyl 1-phosphate transferase [Candidatus Woesebacteria bacterium]|nr:undecaprenyl/decaprenyl-phosphate alpha-N-acetylglucosaminyl 1-phosphate transferase [Candidatus Woesebacteria bacterium]